MPSARSKSMIQRQSSCEQAGVKSPSLSDRINIKSQSYYHNHTPEKTRRPASTVTATVSADVDKIYISPHFKKRRPLSPSAAGNNQKLTMTMSQGFQDKHMLIGQVEEYNRRIQLPAFHIKGSFTTENDLEYEGALRFFLEHAENNFTKAIKLTSSTTWKSLKPQLYDKFNLKEGVLTGKLVPILYAVKSNGEEQSVRDDDRPLVLALLACASIHFILRVYEPGGDSAVPTSDLSKNSKMNQSNKFFAAMKKKLNRGKSKEQLPLSSSPRSAATLSRDRDPIGPLSNAQKHMRQKSDNSSIGSRKKSDASSRKASATLASSAAATARSMENLSKAGKTMNKKQKASRNTSNSVSNMLAIDDTEEYIFVHGNRAEFGADEIRVKIDGSMTVRDIITDVLDECDISLTKIDDYTLCDVIGREVEGMWLTDYSRDMNDSEKPLLLISMMKPSEGLIRRFEIHNMAKDEDNVNRDSHSEVDYNFQQRVIQRHASASLSSISNTTDHSTQPMKFPSDTPYFLTIQSYDSTHDPVLHLISRTTSIIGSSADEEECSLRLYAADILPQHCWVCKVYENEEDIHYQCLSLAPFPGARVKINDTEIHKKTNIRPGDIIAMGQHYVFLFKDPNSSKVYPTDVAALAKHISRQSSDEPRVVNHGWQSIINEMESLSLSDDKQNELLNRIFTIVNPLDGVFKLTPAYLLAYALDCGQRCMKQTDFGEFLTKTCNSFQQTILESAKTLQAHAQDPECNNPLENLETLAFYLQHMFFWMANCIELRAYVSANLTPSGHRSQIAEALDESVIVLTDAVTYAFQQTVYHLTKVLYPTLDLILTDNPFSHTSIESPTMQDVLHTLSAILRLSNGMSLSSDTSQQLITYLYFFLGTSLCNKMFEQGNQQLKKETAGIYYKWEEGVKIRKNLELLESWASENDVEQANAYLTKAVAIADFLATSKQFLLQATWNQLRNLYPAIGPAQLRHLLDNYDIGTKSVPSQWCPPSDEIYRIMEESIMVSFDDHPPLVLPSHSNIKISYRMDSRIPPHHLEYISLCFSQHHSEDETDSGFDLGHSRSPTDADDHSKQFNDPVKRGGSRSSNNSENKSYTPIFKKKKDSGPTRRSDPKPKPKEPVILHNETASEAETDEDSAEESRFTSTAVHHTVNHKTSNSIQTNNS